MLDLKESWAVAVGWWFTKERYNWSDNNSNLRHIGRQHQSIDIHNKNSINYKYTSCLVDLMDRYSQHNDIDNSNRV